MAVIDFSGGGPAWLRPTALGRYLAAAPGGAAVWKVAVCLVIVDLALIFGHVLGSLAEWLGLIAAMPPVLSVFGDESVAERTNHAKWAFVAIAMAVLFVRTRAAAFLALAFVFALVLADDALRVHERGAWHVLRAWPDLPTFGMDRHQAAEMMVWGGLGVIVLPLILLGLFLTDRRWYRPVSYILLGFCAAVLAGVGLDTLQQPLNLLDPGGLRDALLYAMQIAECLAESLAASLTAGLALGLLLTFARRAATGTGGTQGTRGTQGPAV